VGRNIAQAAAMVLACPIIGVNLHKQKLEMGKKVGLTHGIVGGSKDVNSEICKIVGEQGADIVIETTGNARVIEQAYELTHSAGKTILVGVPTKGENVSIYTLPLHFKKVLTGSHGGSAEPHLDIPRFIKLIRAGKMTLDGIITHEFSLGEINEALELVRGGQAGRVLVNVTDN